MGEGEEVAAAKGGHQGAAAAGGEVIDVDRGAVVVQDSEGGQKAAFALNC